MGSLLNQQWSPIKTDDEKVKREKDVNRENMWYGPRLGKRNKNADELSQSEIDDLMENVQKSTELQNLLAEKFQMEGQIIPFVIFVNGRHIKPPQPRLMTPRLGRDAPDSSQNLNSRPYPPRFGRQLPPFSPRLGRSSADTQHMDSY
ncbi:unnamed protein product [Diamesa serratosioi]